MSHMHGHQLVCCLAMANTSVRRLANSTHMYLCATPLQMHLSQPVCPQGRFPLFRANHRVTADEASARAGMSPHRPPQTLLTQPTDLSNPAQPNRRLSFPMIGWSPSMHMAMRSWGRAQTAMAASSRLLCCSSMQSWIPCMKLQAPLRLCPRV